MKIRKTLFAFVALSAGLTGPAVGAPLTLERNGRRVAAFDRAQAVLAECRVAASPTNAVYGFEVPFYAPGGAYGSNWWQLDHSVAVTGVKWYDADDAARALDGLARVMRPDGRIPLYGCDEISQRKGWFSEQSKGLSSYPAFFRAAHAVAVWRGDRDFARRMANLSERYLGWWLSNRVDRATGLVTAVFEETFPPYLGRAGEVASPATCAEVAAGAALTADLFARIGEREKSAAWKTTSDRLFASARTALWNPACGLFGSKDVRTGAFVSADALGQSLLRDPQLPSDRRAAVREALSGPRFVRGAFGATSVPTDDARFQLTRSNTYQGNASWSGMVWSLINVRLVEGLRVSGFTSDADALARKTVEMLEREDDFYEFYDPTDGKGCGVKGYAWTAADYLQLVLHDQLGISYDGFTRTLAVKPRTTDDFRLTGLVLPGKGGVTVSSVKGRVSVVSDLDWFWENATNSLRHAERKMADGTVVYVPQGTCKYEAFWLRDYEMMLEAGIVPSERIVPCAKIFLNAVSPRGEGVDCVKFDGTPVYKPGYGSMGENAVLDGCAYTVLVAAHSWRQTKDAWFLAPERLALYAKVLSAIPHDAAGLSWIDPAKDWDRCPWGFTDTVRKTGACLFSSLLEVSARREFAAMLAAAGSADRAAEERAAAGRIAAAINRTFWDESVGLYRAATVRCREHDVFGSAYAVWLGVAEGERARRIATVFRDRYADFVLDGQVRHLSKGDYWELCSAGVGRDFYQNGGYWGTASGWFAWTLSLVDRDLALRTLSDLRRSCERNGSPEWVSARQVECPEYLSTLALPYQAIRRLSD